MFTDTYLDRTAGVFDMRVATDCYVCKSHKRWRHRSMCGSHLHPRADICAVASQAPLPSCPSPSPCPLSQLARGVGTRGEGLSTAFVVSLSCVCCKYWRRGPATWHTRLSTAAARCAGVARFTNTGVPAYHTPDAIRRHAGGGISAGEMLQNRAHMHVQTDPCH